VKGRGRTAITPEDTRAGKTHLSRAGPIVVWLCGGMIAKKLAQLAATAVQPPHHDLDRDRHDAGDFPAGQALHIGEVHHQPGVRLKLPQGSLDDRTRQPQHGTDLR